MTRKQVEPEQCLDEASCTAVRNYIHSVFLIAPDSILRTHSQTLKPRFIRVLTPVSASRVPNRSTPFHSDREGLWLYRLA